MLPTPDNCLSPSRLPTKKNLDATESYRLASLAGIDCDSINLTLKKQRIDDNLEAPKQVLPNEKITLCSLGK